MAILTAAQRALLAQQPVAADSPLRLLLALDDLLQVGTATLSSGTVTVTANITSTSRIFLTMKDPGAGALTTFIALDAPVGSRSTGTPGSFVVNGIDNAKATLATAACTFDWLVVG